VSSTTHHNPFERFDNSMERWLGADMRLIYGMAVPILMVCGLILLLALNPTTWLVIGVLLLELGAGAVVLRGIMALLNDDGNDEEQVRTRPHQIDG
jgi:hypothetical protein